MIHSLNTSDAAPRKPSLPGVAPQADAWAHGERIARAMGLLNRVQPTIQIPSSGGGG